MRDWLLWLVYCVDYHWSYKQTHLVRPDIYLYVKWILWRDNMIDKLRRKIR